uniref:C1q domain-containing protein n=1 Tax=Pinctada fucata TaxID=50426 RepID=A0A194API7_PINFU
MAIMDNDLVNPSTNHIIIFNHVMTNEGNAYNPHTGTFIAPVSGTYFFAMALASPTAAGGHLGIWLQKDGTAVAYLFFDLHSQYWVKRTDTTAVHMNKGESIYAIILSVAGNHTIAGNLHSNLSGFLIQAD